MEQVDTETWSLRRIIARSEAWDKQRRLEERQKVLEEQQQQEAAEGGGPGVASGGEAGGDWGIYSVYGKDVKVLQCLMP